MFYWPLFTKRTQNRFRDDLVPPDCINENMLFLGTFTLIPMSDGQALGRITMFDIFFLSNVFP